MKINEAQLAHFAQVSKRVDKQGHLYKRGVLFNTAYKLRWFVLKGNMLFYYKSERDKTPIGVIILERCRLEQSLRTPPEYYYSFKIIFDGPDTREYELATPRESDMLSWMKVMKNAGYECLRAAVYDLQMRVWEEEDRQDLPRTMMVASVPGLMSRMVEDQASASAKQERLDSIAAAAAASATATRSDSGDDSFSPPFPHSAPAAAAGADASRTGDDAVAAAAAPSDAAAAASPSSAPSSSASAPARAASPAAAATAAAASPPKRNATNPFLADGDDAFDEDAKPV